jgi:hypothetical protein
VSSIDPEAYCRELEAYLCRKNDGHVIRLVGPAFERVAGWAASGIPIRVACAGIDRYFERYYRKGPRRRPVRVEFCEADVLDAFDTWRRAVGIASSVATSRGLDGQAQEAEDDPPPRPRSSLPAHIERVIARLTALRASASATPTLQPILEQIARELDTLQPEARGLRGQPREAVLDRLIALDRVLIDAAMAHADDRSRQAAEADADAALAPFRARMAPEAFDRARRAAVEQQIRLRYGLPTIAFG